MMHDDLDPKMANRSSGAAWTTDPPEDIDASRDLVRAMVGRALNRTFAR